MHRPVLLGCGLGWLKEPYKAKGFKSQSYASDSTPGRPLNMNMNMTMQSQCILLTHASASHKVKLSITLIKADRGTCSIIPGRNERLHRSC